MTDPLSREPLASLWEGRFAPGCARLRFELGGAFDNRTQQVPRFLQAHRRACAIADVIFPNGCIAVVGWCGGHLNKRRINARVRDGFDALAATGFQSRVLAEWRASSFAGVYHHEDELGWTIRTYAPSDDKSDRDILLWHVIATEMPIDPSVAVVAIFVDVLRNIIMYVYDDRGMDVVAADPAALRHVYADYNEWLLDYDRERMSGVF